MTPLFSRDQGCELIFKRINVSDLYCGFMCISGKCGATGCVFTILSSLFGQLEFVRLWETTQSGFVMKVSPLMFLKGVLYQLNGLFGPNTPFWTAVAYEGECVEIEVSPRWWINHKAIRCCSVTLQHDQLQPQSHTHVINGNIGLIQLCGSVNSCNKLNSSQQLLPLITFLCTKGNIIISSVFLGMYYFAVRGQWQLFRAVNSEGPKQVGEEPVISLLTSNTLQPPPILLLPLSSLVLSFALFTFPFHDPSL